MWKRIWDPHYVDRAFEPRTFRKVVNKDLAVRSVARERSPWQDTFSYRQKKSLVTTRSGFFENLPSGLMEKKTKPLSVVGLKCRGLVIPSLLQIFFHRPFGPRVSRMRTAFFSGAR
jgi:hypothetical protein